MKKMYIALTAAMVFAAAALTACSGQKEETKVSSQPSVQEETTTLAEYGKGDVVIGKVESLEGEKGILLKEGTLEKTAGTYQDGNPGIFKENGEKKIVPVDKDVKVQAVDHGEKTPVEYFSISEGALLELQYRNGKVTEITLLDDELAAFADQIKTVFEKEDLDALDQMVSYPFYLIKTDGTGMDIKDKKQLIEQKGEIFSKALLETIASYDTSVMATLDIGVVMGEENSGPSVGFDRFPGGKLKITAISAAR